MCNMTIIRTSLSTDHLLEIFLAAINTSEFQRQRRDEEDRLRAMVREFSRSVADVDPNEVFTTLL